ncbi:FAD-dependent oxidoreductase [Thiohalobacter sp. IOR34]|uniref:protein disulfide oxidoreductase n=1 Tax=Thiohalobacter sp. IOR34 TaxID=3057176 RepID=UPI0025B0336D|nr:FAD-dependent oxidoreductase [Thiohalobacter sp. IOR34]WJW76360.1 FAD-dependent oxidoreductase [Thiohalobacter sp. IOR34]
MTEAIDARTREAVRRLFESSLQGPVRLLFFTQRMPCQACREQRALLEALADLSDRLQLEVHDLQGDAGLAQRYGIRRVPATAVLGEQDHGIRFYGVTSGYEFDSLIEAILMVSGGETGLDAEARALARRIRHPLHLEILVTLTCPYCPAMVQLAHQLAYLNPQIQADMIDAAQFPELAQRYQVSGVPRTVVNERPAFEGALPPRDALLEILRLAEPEAYEEVEAALRSQRGERRVRDPDPGHRYQLLIVGAGPAAMGAALYAARKELDLLLLGDRPGGQIVNTAQIENWPGIATIGGQELAEQFRRQIERFPIAERLHLSVDRIERDGQDFLAHAGDGRVYRAQAVIYCAGKRYRTLGVPGEQRFLGHGVAFCATCDAPLFRDKRVAVVGGGNSAFTAARDLLPFAREIHVINILPDFQADPVLIDEVRASNRVRLHPAMEVREFLGRERLSGIRLRGVEDGRQQDLAVEGVFLEIGLVPNSQPLQGLLELNERGEVPVARDQSTAVAGLFAAGDVSDEAVKQILVAAAAGAKAALAAHEYLHALRDSRGGDGGQG